MTGDDSDISGADVADDWIRGERRPLACSWPEDAETEVGRVLPDVGVDRVLASRCRQISKDRGAFRIS